MAILYFIGGVLGLILIVTIPLGLQAFKLANYVLWPFGRSVVNEPGASVAWSVIGNAVWLLLIGWWLALIHVGLAVIFFITISGIPFGVANMKLARLALLPVGVRVAQELTDGDQVVVSVPQLGVPAQPATSLPSTPDPAQPPVSPRAAVQPPASPPPPPPPMP